MITQLLSPFGTPFDLSVLLGALLTTAAVLLASRHQDDPSDHRDPTELPPTHTPTAGGRP